MSHQLQIPERKKNQELPGENKTGKMVAVAVGTVAVVGLIYWLTMGEAKAADTGPVEPVDPVDPDPGPLELYVSPDCKTVKEGSNWWLGWAGERITEAVYQGLGGPLLSNDPNVLNKSTNVVVRSILQPWTDCAVKVPWSDWYVADVPVPTPQQGQTLGSFLQQMDNHRDSFVDNKLVPSIQQYPQLNAMIGKISTGITAVFLDRYNYDPANLDGADLGGSQGLLTATQKSRLMKMGYAITDQAIELFQSDFNVIMMEWVGGEWYGVGMDIPVTNVMDNKTDDALAFAFRSSKGIPWQAMVAQATGLGPDGQPPKQQPTS